MAVGLDIGPNDEVRGITTFFGITFRCAAAVLTTGTFMNGTIWVGRQSMSAGRCVRVQTGWLDGIGSSGSESGWLAGWKVFEHLGWVG
jgi:tRNA uridine 5-carboxymethylaminomethyl modification enzyme